MPFARPIPLVLALAAVWSTRVHAAEPPPSEGQTEIRAERIEGEGDRTARATGQVELRRGTQKLEADWVKFDNRTQDLCAGDRTRLTQSGSVLEGGQLTLNNDTRIGALDAPRYQLGGARMARGDGLKLLFDGPDRYRIVDGRLTTCKPGDDDWFIRARSLDLDYTRNLGVARHATVDFLGVPILYTPYIDFSLDGARKSGFLAPTFGSNGSGGLDISLPWYWNIAPNDDATFTPRWVSRRGLLLNGEFRYLEPTFRGTLKGEVIAHDQLAQKRRSTLLWQHDQQLAPDWTASVNLQRASDDRYFADFGDRVAVASATYLPREGIVSYADGRGLSMSLRTQRFQTLQDPANPVAIPYARLPQFNVGWSHALYGPLRFDLSGEAVNFSHPTQVQGQRYTLYPQLSLPWMTAYGFVTPKLGYHLTRYQLERRGEVSRTLPVLTVDSGLFFDREFTWQGRSMVQSLEPRLYYVRMPYRDQSTLPNFDSAQTDFSFVQMFNENRFAGGDRLNDANQLSTALTSRIFDAESGVERLRASVGQIHYFSRPRVGLTGNLAETAEIRSDLIATAGGQLTDPWWLDAGVQYDRSQRRAQKVALNLRYQPDPARLLNLRYRLDRLTNVKQIDISGQWPLGRGWYGLARQNWSITDRRALESLVGVEYNAGCWVFRMVSQRFVTAANTVSTPFFFQIELNQVGQIGSNPIQTLRDSIPGYTKRNTP